MRLTDGMLQGIVATGCLIAVLLTITGMVLLIPGGGPPASCVRHGGVVKIHEAGDTSSVYFICRDGKIVKRP